MASAPALNRFPIDRDAACALAAAALAKPDPRLETLRSLAEVCRRSGTLGACARLVDRWFDLALQAHPTDPMLRLRSIFAGDPPPHGADGDGRGSPQPFVRETALLLPERYKAIQTATRAALGGFEPASIYDGAKAEVNAGRRRSAVRRDAEEMRALVLPEVRALMKRNAVWRRLGLTSAPSGGYELQNSRHGDGDFFRTHRDSQEATNLGRAISFVFYYTLNPDAFTGGDLLIHDLDETAPTRDCGGYTRIPPRDNSIVFFASTAAHEVTPVISPRAGPEDGRFTLNGWAHW